MSLTVSVRTEYVNAKKYNFQLSHDRRDRKKIPNYINPELSHENSRVLDRNFNGKELLEAARKAREKAYEEGLHKRRIVIKDDAAVAFRCVITFGKEAQKLIKELPIEKQNELYLEIARRISKTGGTQLLSLYAHRDEQAPHAHFTMCKFDENGKTIRFTRQDLKNFQDIAGEVCSEFGLPISRGIPREKRFEGGDPTWQYIHKSVRELHYSLPNEVEMKKNELRSIEQDLERRNQDKDRIYREIQELEERHGKRLKDYENIERLLEKAKKELAELSKKGMAESEKAKKLEKRISTYENRLTNYDKDILGMENKKAEKQKELDDLMQALKAYNELLRERKDIVDENEHLRNENKKLRKLVVDMQNDIIKFGSRTSTILERSGSKVVEVVEKVFEKASFDSPTIDLLLNAFYGEIEAYQMRE